MHRNGPTNTSYWVPLQCHPCPHGFYGFGKYIDTLNVALNSHCQSIAELSISNGGESVTILIPNLITSFA